MIKPIQYPSPIRVCHCKVTDDDPLVKNDLSITPARMWELAEKGIPISEQTAAAVSDADFIEGYSKLDFDPPHVYTRHADIISAWNTQIESRNKILNFEQQRHELGLDVQEKGA